MPKIVVVDTSVLIALEKINLFELLCQLYDQVYIPQGVYQEFGKIQLKCLKIKKIKEKLVDLLSLNLGRGEAEAIYLAFKYTLPLLVGDLKARKIAKSLNLKISGILGILLKAHQYGYLEDPLEKLLELREKGFYISEEILKEAKKIFKQGEIGGKS